MERIDLLLVKRGLALSREKAKAIIMAGEVLVEGKVVDKPGTRVALEAAIKVNESPPYVSRGGLKLSRALEVFPVEIKGRICLDAGASTGGFTDCLLQSGAERVIAVDVGYGQFAWKLRQDPRVVLMEKTNIRYLTPDQLPMIPSLITADLSFISITKVLPAFVSILPANGEIISLIKPQFEAGRDKVGKNGVVRSAETQQEVLTNIAQAGFIAGLNCAGLTYSPLLGAKGNIEFLIYWQKGEAPRTKPSAEKLANIVNQAWENLK
jgi:23S rRNA (cytidine1920-2'-O)/16S rRNA (cytidine1409-2'-O)-methyltransferase